MQNVSIVGFGRIPVQKQVAASIREMGVGVLKMALEDAGVSQVDSLFVGNMVADELQGQKHLASLIASEAGLRGVEAMQVRAATATGAAALRMAYLAVASGEARVAVALGVEKMRGDGVTPALAKALDAELEVPTGATLLSQNAKLMQMYMQRFGVSAEVFNPFPLVAHQNANNNPFALFKNKPVTNKTISESRIVSEPMRLYDASPICEGAAAVVLMRSEDAAAHTETPVQVLASSAATDWFRVEDRPNPLDLFAARVSAARAFSQAGISRESIDFFELHDAFSIMSVLLLEAVGFAEVGQGWRLGADGIVARDGKLPVCTMGGLKARGHPIGATALYQTIEIMQQLTGQAGANQIAQPKIGMLQSIGGAGSTVLTHLFRV